MTTEQQAAGPGRRVLGAMLTAAGAALVLPRAALAFNEGSPADINVDAQGVALRGFDPVSYQTGRAPARGSAQWRATHAGATYHFASAANRDAFRASPDRYVPAFGGFCAMGVAMSRKLDGDPQLYRVVEGRLYLNVNAAVQRRWLEDIPGNIQRANATWPSLRGKTPRELNG